MRLPETNENRSAETAAFPSTGCWTRFSVIYLLALMLVRLGVQLRLHQRGFISVSADEFTRGIRAARWAANPQFDLLADVGDLWLPLEKYLNGTLLLVWPDVMLAPRATVFAASCLLLVGFYYLVFRLTDRTAVAVLGTLFLSFQPWFAWLSGTPMLDMYYLAVMVTGLGLLVAWLQGGLQRGWAWAGLFFALASGLHVASWVLINVVNLLTLPFLFASLRRRENGRIARLIAFYLLGNALILGFTLIEYVNTGQVFAFLAAHTSYSRWVYGGYNVPVLEKLLYYPRIVVQNGSGVVWVCVLLSLPFLIRDRRRGWVLLPLLIGGVTLLVNSVMNVFSGPPSAAPARYSLLYTILLSFYVGYATFRLFWAARERPRRVGLPMGVIGAALFAYGLIWGAVRIPDYPQGMPPDAVAVGEALHQVLDQEPGVYMVELRYWEYLAVNLASGRYDALIFDRVQDFRDRTTPSIFLQAEGEVCRRLADASARYVLLKEAALKQRATALPFLAPRQDVGAWTIYDVRLDAAPGCR